MSLTAACVAAGRHASAVRQPDHLLLPFLHAADDRAARAHLDRLIREHADPIISSVVRRHGPDTGIRFRSEGDASDLRGETIALLLSRLQATRETSADIIGDFRAYVKVTARHVCWHRRRSTREQVRPLGRRETGEGEEPPGSAADDPADPHADTLGLILRRGLLGALWTEIRILPPAQRTALLLNFRDAQGANALPLLSLCGITTPAEIAATLGLPLTEIASLAECLPLEDSAVAERLGITRREVINLRVAARRRLERRLRAWLEPA
jgi:DNA-directed RNA polymerase specialized sigma24 family protein